MSTLTEVLSFSMLAEMSPEAGAWLIGFGLLIVIASMILLSRHLEKRGILRNYSRGLGRGLLGIEPLFRPSRQHIVNVKDKQRTVRDDAGDGDDPDE